MKVIYTEGALADLGEICEYQAEHWPMVRAPFEARLTAIERHILHFPDAAPEVASRPGVRVVSFVAYPYRLFYQRTANGIEILFIHHTSRRPWYEA